MKKRQYYINNVCDERGRLTVADCAKDLPFEVKRVFWITNVPIATSRGGHAHRTCNELLFVLNGSFTLHIGDESFHMTNDGMGVAIWANEWCDLIDFEPQTVVLVLASEEFRPEGYVYNKNQ